MTSTLDIKAERRRDAFAARKAAHASARGAADAACARFLAAGLHADARIVSGYCPIRTEIDPTPLMTALHGMGRTLCVPEITGPGEALLFREWHPGVAMSEGPFGAAVPVGTETVVPDLVIAPLLCFDRQGWRLGYGGGFYDRTLEGLRGRRPVTAIGLAYAAQEIAAVPVEPTDQRLDAIVTERGVIRAGGET